jgi:hypothetical protein
LFGLHSKNVKPEKTPLISCWTAQSVYTFNNQQLTLLAGEPETAQTLVDEFILNKAVERLPKVTFHAQTSREK